MYRHGGKLTFVSDYQPLTDKCSKTASLSVVNHYFVYVNVYQHLVAGANLPTRVWTLLTERVYILFHWKLHVHGG